MFDAGGEVRPAYRGIFKALAESSREDLDARIDALGRAFIDQGVTFSLSGRNGRSHSTFCRGSSRQPNGPNSRAASPSVQALELFLDDVYGTQEILRDGCCPNDLSTRVSTFTGRRQISARPTGVRIHVAGIDLIRDEKRRVPGAGGQPALAVGCVVCDREPAHHGAGVSGPVRLAQGAGGRRLSEPSAARAAGVGGVQRGRPQHRGSHSGRGQFGVLRTFAAGSADGRRTRRGP